jgi:prepilin-type N-terminal cleavage/methylation domain-containing protein
MRPVASALSAGRRREHGFTLIELLISVAVTTLVLGATFAAMNDAMRTSDGAIMLTNMNYGLRTSMDIVVRDLLQVGQGLPSGRVIHLPSGNGSSPIRLPGPRGTNYQLAGATELTAVTPGPGLGPVFNGQATDMIITIAADSAFDQRLLTALAADGRSMTVWNGSADLGGANITDGGPDDVSPGDLMMLTKGSLSALVQVTAVNGQVVTFADGDSLNLNQSGAADGTVAVLRASAPADVLANPAPNPPVVTTAATRIRMVTYYMDVTTDPTRPRLVRRMNNGDPTTFNNDLGTAVAFDIENLQISYDLAGGANPSNVRMDASDLDGSGACSPDECSPNMIRKINVALSGRSKLPLKNTRDFLHNTLHTQVSLRSLAFVDRYR